MRRHAMLWMSLLAAWSAQACAAHAVGEEYEILSSYETTSETGDGEHSGSSSGRNGYLERVIAVRADGLEIEYDLPKGTPPKDRQGVWQFPVRFFRPTIGQPQILNLAELEGRIDAWLKTAKWTREMCGRTFFTWNLFKIECDPQAVLADVAAIDLRAIDAREGVMHREENAKAPAPIKRVSSQNRDSILVAKLEVDPESVRRGNAESDVILGEIVGEPVSLQAAMKKRARERYSGTIVVSFITDAKGNLNEVVRATYLKTEDAKGTVKIDKKVQILKRKLVSDQKY